MNLTPMRYKNYTWPYNPRVYTINFERKMAVHKVPFGRCHLQDLGLTRRILRGEGEFLGSGAYEEFKKLATVFYDDGPGLLIHPVWQISNAYFVELALRQEPRENYVSYSFTFWEESGGCDTEPEVIKAAGTAGDTAGSGTAASAAGQAQYHTVIRGETLWGIARRNGLALNAVIAMNPQIAHPNLIYPGQQVRVA